MLHIVDGDWPAPLSATAQPGFSQPDPRITHSRDPFLIMPNAELGTKTASVSSYS